MHQMIAYISNWQNYDMSAWASKWKVRRIRPEMIPF